MSTKCVGRYLFGDPFFIRPRFPKRLLVHFFSIKGFLIGGMIKFLLCFGVGLAAAFDASDCTQNKHETWMCQYMKNHDKAYSHAAEFLLRKTKVSQSVEAIRGLGSGFGLTPRSDQFRIPQNIALSLLHHKQVLRSAHQKHVYKTPPNLPTLDWRTSGQYVTNVVDQGVCGDCFAFASAAVLEYWLAKTGSPLESISSQLLMDCTSGSGRPDMGGRINGICL
jgi:hypothetical protein